MGPYSRVLRDYKYTSEYAILKKNSQENVAKVALTNDVNKKSL